MISSRFLSYGTALAVFLITLIFVVPAQAQQTSRSDAGMVQIDRIELEGIRVWSRSDVREVIEETGLRSGMSFRREEFQTRVSQAIERLYSEGLFSDIQAQRDGQTLVFEIEEFPQVSDMIFRGNESIQPESLRDALILQRGDPASEGNISKARKQLKDFYQSEGFGNARVETRLEEGAGGRVVVVFEISEGSRDRIGGVYLEYKGGKNPFSQIRQNWSLRMIIPLKKGDPYAPQRIRQVTQMIEQWYHNKGRLDVSVESRTRPLTRDRGLELTFVIDEGPVYKLGSVTIEGNEVFNDRELRKQLKLEQGDVFSRRKLIQGLQSMENRYQDRGYTNASVFDPSQFRIQPDRESLRAHVEVRIVEGPPFLVEDIELRGNQVTYDKVIMREVTLKEGKLLDGKKLRNSQRRVRNLGFFEDVKFNVDPGSRENTKIVRIRVRERPTGQLSFGGGFSSSTGFVGSMSVSKDNFSLWDWSNGFTGRGQSLSVSAQLGSRQDNFNLSWDEPWLNDDLDEPNQPSPEVPISLGWSAFNTDNEIQDNTFSQQNTGGSVRIGREFGPTLSNQVDAQYTFRSTTVEGLRFTDNPPESFEFEAQRTGSDSDEFSRDVGSIQIGIQRDRRNDRRFPSDGYFLRTTMQTAWEGFGGNSDFFQPQFDSRVYVPFFFEDLFWAWRFNYKTVDTWADDQSAIPEFEKFFLGGQNDVRGYESDEIAIFDDQGNQESGGESATFSKLELRLQLIDETMQGFLFTDMGQVAPNAWDFDSSNIKTSVGLGFRVRSPIGPINISWGQRLNDTFPTANDSGETQLDFNIGTGF